MNLSVFSILIAFLSLLVSIAAFFQGRLLGPKVQYSVMELTEYPVSDRKLSLSVKRAEVGDFVELKYGITVHLWSTGWKSASNVQIRVKAEGGAVIVQVHREDDRLVERLPDIGRQGSREVFLTIPLLVPGEETKLTFWYGIPGAGKAKPPIATVLVRHSDGLGELRSMQK